MPNNLKYKIKAIRILRLKLVEKVLKRLKHKNKNVKIRSGY